MKRRGFLSKLILACAAPQLLLRAAPDGFKWKNRPFIYESEQFLFVPKDYYGNWRCVYKYGWTGKCGNFGIRADAYQLRFNQLPQAVEPFGTIEDQYPSLALSLESLKRHDVSSIE